MLHCNVYVLMEVPGNACVTSRVPKLEAEGNNVASCVESKCAVLFDSLCEG